MSESQLNVSITARDTASQQIKGLQGSIRALDAEIRRTSASGADASGQYAAALGKEISAINTQIGVIRQQAGAINTTTGAMRQQASAASTLSASLTGAAAGNTRLSQAESSLTSTAMAKTAALERQAKATDISGKSMEEATKKTVNWGRESSHLVSVFDELSRNQRGQIMSTMGAAFRDMGLGTATLASTVGGLVAIMAGFHVIKYAEELGKWATELRAGASAAGMSVEAYSELRGALEALDIKGGDADATLRHFAESLSKAVAEPAGQVAEAFHNLYISQEALIKNAGSVSGGLNLMAEAFVQNADGANKSENMQEILGYAFQRIIPLFQDGVAGLHRYTEAAKENGRVITEVQAKSLQDLGLKIDEVGKKITAGVIPAFLAWKPVIVAVAEAAGGLVQILGSVLSKMGEILSFPIQDIQRRMEEARAAGTIASSRGGFTPGGRGSPGDADTGGTWTQTGRWRTFHPNPRADRTVESNEPSDSVTAGRPVAPLTKGDELSEMQKMRADASKASRDVMESAVQLGTKPELAAAQAEAAEVASMQRSVNATSAGNKMKLQMQEELDNRTRVMYAEQNRLAHEGQASRMQLIEQEASAAAKVAGERAGNSKSALQAENAARIAVMQSHLHDPGLDNKEQVELQKQLNDKQTSLRNEQLSGGASGARRSYEDFAAAEKEKIAEAQGSSAKIIEIYKEWIATAKAMYGVHASDISNIERQMVQEVTKARLEELRSGAKQEEQGNRLLHLNDQLAAIAGGKMKFSGEDATPAALIARSQAALDEAGRVKTSGTAQMAVEQQAYDAAPDGSSERRTAAKEIISIETDMKERLVQLYREAGNAAEEAAKKTNEAFVKFFDSVGSQFEAFTGSVVKALVAPQQEIIKQGMTSITTSLRSEEIRKAATTLFTSVAGDVGKTIEEAAGHAIAGALSNVISGVAGNTMGELLGSLMSKAISSIVGSAAGSAVGNVAGSAAGNVAGGAVTTAAVTAGATATVTAVGANAISVNAGLVTQTLALGAILSEGFLTLNANILGLNAKPSVLGTTYAAGGIVPSAAGGMITSGGTGGSLAILHAREMVLPAHISEGMQNMIARSGGNNSSSNSLSYSPTINAGGRGRNTGGMSRGEFTQMMSMHSGMMMGEFRNMVRSGWRPA